MDVRSSPTARDRISVRSLSIATWSKGDGVLFHGFAKPTEGGIHEQALASTAHSIIKFEPNKINNLPPTTNGPLSEKLLRVYFRAPNPKNVAAEVKRGT